MPGLGARGAKLQGQVPAPLPQFCHGCLLCGDACRYQFARCLLKPLSRPTHFRRHSAPQRWPLHSPKFKRPPEPALTVSMCGLLLLAISKSAMASNAVLNNYSPLSAWQSSLSAPPWRQRPFTRRPHLARHHQTPTQGRTCVDVMPPAWLTKPWPPPSWLTKPWLPPCPRLECS